MSAIRILANCAAAGQHLAAGRVVAVPADLPAEAAAALVRMGRAVAAPAPQVETDKPKRAVQRRAAD